MKVLQELGVRKFIIITNPKYKTKFREFAEKSGFNAQIINEHPEKGNGYSLYLAKNWVDGRFILVMSDHIYEKAFLERALKGKGLIVDKAPKYTSIKEETKVKIKNNRAEDLWKAPQGV